MKLVTHSNSAWHYVMKKKENNLLRNQGGSVKNFCHVNLKL